jgi:hypothetical protein
MVKPCPHKESTIQCPPCRRLYKTNKQREYRLKRHKQLISQPASTFRCTHPKHPSKGDGPTKYCLACRRLIHKIHDKSYRLRKEAKRRREILRH